MSRLSLVLACLRALDIGQATVSLDGSGDSGDATFDQAITCSDQTLHALPRLTVGPHGTQLPDLVCEVAAELPEGNWYDNEGGYGTVTFYPFEVDPDAQVCIEMTYRDEYESDESDFDDEGGDGEGEEEQADEDEPATGATADEAALPIITEQAGDRS